MASPKEIIQALDAAYTVRADFAALVFLTDGTRTLDQIAITGSLRGDIRVVVMVAKQQGWLYELLREAADERPQLPELARLRDSVAPISVEAADPWKSLMVNGQPLVDREPLRNAVQDLEQQRSRILVVSGEPTAGKTHIGNLITWRAGANQHKLVVVDLWKLWDAATRNAGGPEARPRLEPREIALSLCDQLEINREIIPLKDEQDSRWGIAFCDQLQGRVKPHVDYWLLFDEYNKVPVSQQAADLIKELVSRVATALPNVRLALLGYDETLLPENVSAAVISKQLEYLSEQDVKTFFVELYQSAGRADDAPAIAASIAKVRGRINPADAVAMRGLGRALAEESREVLRGRGGS